MSQYTQLTQEQRYQIYAFLKAGFLQKEIACEIGVHKSTISREIRRNRGQKGYRSKRAHSMALQRRREANKSIKMTAEIIVLIDRYLCQDFSPDQVCGFLARKNNIYISHERIYQHVLDDKARGGRLYRHLRHANKKRRKRYGSYDRRGRIKARVSIDERPAIVDTKKRIGDW